MSAPASEPGSAAAAPLLEYDADRRGVVEPGALFAKARQRLPRAVVLCTYPELIAELRGRADCTVVGQLATSAHLQPILSVLQRDEHIAVVSPGVGGPLAATTLEGLVALGARVFVLCGVAGATVPDIACGAVVLPVAAVRDEGTSYHYLPPTREVAVDAQVLEAARTMLRRRAIEFREGKSWTTDAFFRETVGRVARRRTEGCVAVEMELASLLAVAEFRGVRLGAVLYAGDDVSGHTWQKRRWMIASARRLTFEAAADLAVDLLALGDREQST